ncbi:MAG: TonB-dependent receptor [Ignavibacteria bacterium]
MHNYGQFRVLGTVTDSTADSPITGAKAEILSHGLVTTTDDNGNFEMEIKGKGTYEIAVTKLGYKDCTQTIIIDSTSNLMKLNFRMITSDHVTDTIKVQALYFRKTDKISTSFVNVENEEIRRSPGAMEDVIRYFTGSPGVSLGSDINNEIIVRGGSPVENLTLIDGLVIQNPNHYGAPGSTNGVLSYINLKMVRDVDFFSGGFPPEYGDKLSAVMDIKFRDGNRNKHIRDINISATGLGGFFEGPITKKSSYIFSVRRSYYELIKDLLNTQLIPEYWDFNTKLSYLLSKTDKLSITGLYATDNAKPIEAGDYMNDTVNVKILSTGIKYSKEGSNFNYTMVAGYGWNLYKVNYEDFKLDINDNELSFSQKLEYTLDNNLSFTIFTGARNFFSKYNVYHGAGYNASNYFTPPVLFDGDVNTLKLSGGFNVIAKLLKDKLILNAGLRIDAFQYIHDKIAVSPRAGVTYKLTPLTTLNANAGIYFQAPEILWVIVDPENRNLSFIRVNEIILGIEHLFSADVKLSIEPYLKQYYNYPVSVYDPNYIFINSGVEIYPNFLDKALSVGEGYYAGVDVTVQKKNRGYGLFGTISYSFSKSEFLALKGDVQPAEFDYGNQITAIAGYKFGFGLSFSGKFKFAKGRPYTPFDFQESLNRNRGMYDKELYNKGRMPDYSRLDVRVDYQVNIGKTQLTTYIEVLNVFNRENYYNYYWSSYYKRLKSNMQLPRIPIVGISYRF